MINLKIKANTEKRDLEILSMVSKGMSSKEIANISNISSHSIDLSLKNMRKKYDALNTVHLVAMLIRRGLIPILIITLFSCSPRITTGHVKAVTGDTVTLTTGQRFTVKGTAPVLGQLVTFTPTVNRGKINSKKL